MANKALLLDRDGTIIKDKHYLNDPAEIEYLPGTFEALKLISESGYLIIIVTNQSGIPRGLISEPQLRSIHEKIQSDFKQKKLHITEFYHAPHLPNSDHPWRKPNPGMLLQAAKDHNLDLSRCWMIGDKDVDVMAGRNAGASTILYGCPVTQYQQINSTHQASHWDEVSRLILSQNDE